MQRKANKKEASLLEEYNKLVESIPDEGLKNYAKELIPKI